MKIYCISGLGADHRVFQDLDLRPHQMVHIDWIQPEQDETLEQYALRMARAIVANGDFSLVGLSFGGMLAVEIAKHVKPVQVFLISSITTKNELPRIYRLGYKLGVHRLVTGRFLLAIKWIMQYMFGIGSARGNTLTRAYLRELDDAFMQWAFRAIIRWKNTDPVECIRIHGTKDRILPVPSAHIDYPIRGGGHLIVVNDARRISAIIRSELSGK